MRRSDPTVPSTDLPNPDDAPSPASAAMATNPPADAPPAGAGPGAVEMDPLAAQQERYLRLAAEYDNYRKRTQREAQQAGARGQAELIRRLLDSLDDLARLSQLDPVAADVRSVLEGVQMIERNLLKALAAVGVEVIDPVELPFDPNLHEAVSTVGANDPAEDHIVAQVYQRGYLMNGQLLRPARVVVKQYQ